MHSIWWNTWLYIARCVKTNIIFVYLNSLSSGIARKSRHTKFTLDWHNLEWFNTSLDQQYIIITIYITVSINGSTKIAQIIYNATKSARLNLYNQLTFSPNTPIGPISPGGPKRPFGPSGPSSPLGPGTPTSPCWCTTHLTGPLKWVNRVKCFYCGPASWSNSGLHHFTFVLNHMLFEEFLSSDVLYKTYPLSLHTKVSFDSRESILSLKERKSYLTPTTEPVPLA